jgi:hypothetical protein
MLNWTKEKNGHWVGFCDGDFLYRVFETPEGWMWEDSQSYEGECDFETERQAMNAAAEHFNKRLAMEERLADIDLETSLGEVLEILGDMLYEERKENKLFS